MKRRSRHILVLSFGAAALLVAATLPALAGPRETALLYNYVGNWTGSSVLVGGSKPERFSCRLRITKGNQSKINYTGRCTAAGTNSSLSGTIGYNDASGAYQATMASNPGYRGSSVGRVRGDKITFDFAGTQSDPSGNVAEMQSQITLSGSKSITMGFRVEVDDPVRVLRSTVAFKR